ncbi:hypothetical protein AB0K15_13195 [Amycolatopsis sp. NPDC049253]|uniref:hypothetical protein n=1 Tax=Amycolatopsis sp. NPDC049253 TaxID=3155274 RepID=UPI00343C638B
MSAWLAQLTDEEVLDKFSRLKVTHTYEPSVLLHNADVLLRLRDEVRNFARAEKSAEE